MTIESAITFSVVIFIFGITPGPGVFAIIARALVSGASGCFLLALGMVVSDILYLVLACYGLAALAEHWSAAFMLVRIAGAIYLICLGIKMWRASRQQHPVEIELNEKPGMSFLQGFIISASNPKVILFYIAFLPTFMDLTILTRADIALAAFLTFAGLMVGLMMIAAGASSVRRYVRSARGQKLLNRSAGSIMIGAGAYLFSSG
jgi:threonine/homoserine/homoserine lactone efflux protein